LYLKCLKHHMNKTFTLKIGVNHDRWIADNGMEFCHDVLDTFRLTPNHIYTLTVRSTPADGFTRIMLYRLTWFWHWSIVGMGYTSVFLGNEVDNFLNDAFSETYGQTRYLYFKFDLTDEQ